MSNWMQDFLSSTKELESPTRYFYWALLTTISSVVGRRMWVDRGGVYKLYPNIYTFLISKKSGLRKGIPVNVSKKLANEVGTVRVIDGQNSIQGVLKDLSQVKTLNSGHIIRTAEGFLVTGEFASFLISDGSNFSMATLTDLYDSQYHDHGFSKKLSTQDEIKLKDPCLTALFASNETHFFDVVPKVSMNGGFLARTFCIYEEKRNRINSLTKKVEESIDYPRMTAHLKSLSLLNGEILANEDALELFDAWYNKFCNEEHEDETGTSERLGDNIWKAAMLIGLANHEEGLIDGYNMAEAIDKSIATFNDLKRLLTGGSGDAKSIKSIVMRTVFAMLIGTDPLFEIDRKLILRKGAGIFGVYDLDECVEHLLQAGMIKLNKNGTGMVYKLTDMVINKHKSIKGNSNGKI